MKPNTPLIIIFSFTLSTFFSVSCSSPYQQNTDALNAAYARGEVSEEGYAQEMAYIQQLKTQHSQRWIDALKGMGQQRKPVQYVPPTEIPGVPVRPIGTTPIPQSPPTRYRVIDEQGNAKFYRVEGN